MMSDPLADLLTRMKNACMAKHRQLAVPHSKLKEALVKLLVVSKHVAGYEVIKGEKPSLIIKQPRLETAKRLSKPGSRLYAETKELFRYLRGRGITILSTSKGLMTAREAYQQKLGGELLCRII